MYLHWGLQFIWKFSQNRTSGRDRRGLLYRTILNYHLLTRVVALRSKRNTDTCPRCLKYRISAVQCIKSFSLTFHQKEAHFVLNKQLFRLKLRHMSPLPQKPYSKRATLALQKPLAPPSTAARGAQHFCALVRAIGGLQNLLVSF